MMPALNKSLPFLAPLLLGALAYLALGEGPASTPVRAGDAVAWQLPVVQAPDTAQAASLWTSRSPWGSEAPLNAETPGIVTRPVGVVAVGDRLFALFTQGDLVVRVAQDGALADGGKVTAIRPDVVEWTDGAGAPQRRELLVEIVQAGTAADSSARPSARDRGRARATNANRANRPAPAAREAGQRRARQSVPNSGSDQFKSRRPSSTGG